MTNRPKKKTTLVRQAKSLAGKEVTDAMAEKLVEELRQAKFIAIDEKGAVAYKI